MKLFEPGKIGRLELKNRIVMPPMSTGFATIWGEASPVMVDFFRARARGGAALLFVEVAAVAPSIDPLKQLPRMLRLDDDGFVPPLAEVVESVHEADAKVGIQLTPGFASQARLGPWIPGQHHVQDVRPVGPSAVPHPEVQRVARELTPEEIAKIVELFGWAAARAKEAGFDIIEIHAHSGFLLGQFLSPYFNRRVDQYGGSPERRLRFLLDIIESTRANVGNTFPLTVKFSIDEFLEGGRGLQEGQMIAQTLETHGIDSLTVSSGIHGAKLPSMPSMYQDDGTFVMLSEAVKDVVSIPVILPGKLGDPQLAERVLEDGKADFIAWGRPLIADPDLPRKVLQGRLDEIRRCIYCNECIRVQWAHRFPLRCTVNPVAGRENRLGVIRRAEVKKTVAVVGAGPAGMEAARVAGLRGHDVVLFEKSGELGGGQLKLAAIPPRKDVLQHIARYYANAFKQLDNVQLVLGKDVTAEELTTTGIDVVILATGADTSVPEIDRTENADPMTAHQLLSEQRLKGKTAIVVGGGSIGCEVANFLAARGKDVTIVEMSEAVATDVHSMLRLGLLHELSERGVTILTGVRVDAITSNGVEGVAESGRVRLQGDMVVCAVGTKPNHALAEALRGKVENLYIIGDAKQPRRIREAISEGHITACDI